MLSVNIQNYFSNPGQPQNAIPSRELKSDVFAMLFSEPFVLDGKLIVLMEHQSTVNSNMPLRMLIYIAREYEKITTSKNLYKEMKLSDSFELRNDACSLELAVKAYNINRGRNAEMASRSPTLNDYEIFIAEINENLKTMSLPSAIKTAMASCISKGILVYFLRENGSEVENMLLTGWNMKDALAVAREEGTEDGIAIGIEKGREEGVAIGEARGMEKLLAYLKQGHSLEEAENLLAT